MDNIDILEIHNQILKKFEDDKKNIEEFESSVKNLEKFLSDPSISHNIRLKLDRKWGLLKEKLKDITLDTSYNFYLMETGQLIEKYKKFIRKPVKINFMGKKEKPQNFICNYRRVQLNIKSLSL